MTPPDPGKEREAIVAWLREEAAAQRRLSNDQRGSNLDRHVYEIRSNFTDMLADAIERLAPHPNDGADHG